jgi:nucleoside-diphosphate-sugar epimerase
VTNDGDITPREFVAALSEGLGRPITAIPFPEPAALAVAHGVRAVLRVVGPGLYPGSITGAVRFWRGGNPYTSARAAKELGWTPSVPHGRRIAELVRRYAAG